MKFQTIVLTGKKTATGIEVPASVVEHLSVSRKPAVVATVNGYVYRTTVGLMNGHFMLPLSAEHRQRSGLKAGDAVEVQLAVDTEPRSVEVPEDLANALSSNPLAKTSFEGLSYSKQRWFVLNVEAAKTAPTREKRVGAAIATLLSESRT